MRRFKNNTFSSDMDLVFGELQKAMIKWPGWPMDPIHAAAIVQEEAGELIQACLRWTYEDGQSEDMVHESAHVAVTAIRFIHAYQAQHYKRRIDPLHKCDEDHA